MKEKYADVLLQNCLCIKDCEMLLITAPIEAYEFIRILSKKASELGIKKVVYDFEDEYLKKLQLENLLENEFDDGSFWDKSIYDKYIEKNCAFLVLTSFEDLSSNLVSEKNLQASNVSYRQTRLKYKKKQLNYEVPWCIAGVATKNWADKIFKDDENSLEKLWELIYKICYIDQRNPLEAWKIIQNLNKLKSDYMNFMQFDCLEYHNSLGTNLSVKLPKNHIWNAVGVTTKLPNGKSLMVNMPSYEIFTSPLRDGVNGIVYSSKPFVYNGVLIEDMRLKFKEGKVVELDAKCGKKALESLINTDEFSSFLGETALVDNDNPIQKSNIVFYECLFDENAASHLAFGNGFKSCVDMNFYNDENIKNSINFSSVHEDFMIGTSDLVVYGIKDEKKTTIVEEGNFVRKLIL